MFSKERSDLCAMALPFLLHSDKGSLYPVQQLIAGMGLEGRQNNQLRMPPCPFD